MRAIVKPNMILSNCCNFAVNTYNVDNKEKLNWICRNCKRKLTDYGVYGKDFVTGKVIKREDFENEY